MRWTTFYRTAELCWWYLQIRYPRVRWNGDTPAQPWSDLGGVIRGKAVVLDGWRHDLERHQRQERAALGRAHGAQALEVDRRAQRTYERAMHEPVRMHREDRDAIAQELKH